MFQPSAPALNQSNSLRKEQNAPIDPIYVYPCRVRFCEIGLPQVAKRFTVNGDAGRWFPEESNH